MTEQELIREIGRITKLLTGELLFASVKQTTPYIKELRKYQVELNRLQGKTWTREDWPTQFRAISRKSLKDARLELIKMLEGLPGVEIEPDKNGTCRVHVYTDWKIYCYEIHAHYSNEEVGSKKECGLFDDPNDPDSWQEWPVYEQVFCAWLETGENKWYWRFE